MRYLTHYGPVLLPCAALGTLAVSACVSTGTLGLAYGSGEDPGRILREPHAYHELGPAEGRSCRYFLLAIIPFGNSTFSAALTNALKASGGDALLNVSTSSSLYGVAPIYNVFSLTCTTVRGTAIAIEKAVGAPPRSR